MNHDDDNYDPKAEAQQMARQAEEAWQQQVKDGIRQGGVMGDVLTAAKSARDSAQADGLHAGFNDDGESFYTLEQGAKAACMAREDVAATLILQSTQLKSLSSIQTMLLVCIALLGYIAYRVS